MMLLCDNVVTEAESWRIIHAHDHEQSGMKKDISRIAKCINWKKVVELNRFLKELDVVAQLITDPPRGKSTYLPNFILHYHKFLFHLAIIEFWAKLGN